VNSYDISVRLISIECLSSCCVLSAMVERQASIMHREVQKTKPRLGKLVKPLMCLFYRLLMSLHAQRPPSNSISKGDVTIVFLDPDFL